MASKKKTDVLGLAALDYLRGKKDATIMIEMDVAGIDPLPVSYLFRNYRSMPSIEKKALNLCRGKIVDVGAGTGIHVDWLQKKGFEVHALDHSPQMVEVMEKMGIKNIHHKKLTDFHMKGFDTILLLMNGIGLVQRLKNLKPFLRHASSLLNPGGQILIESTDIIYIYEQQDGSYLVPLHKNYYGEVEMIARYDGLISHPFRWVYVDSETLAAKSSEVGLETEIIFRGRNHNYLARLTLSNKRT